jgi:hypothetical protein
MFGNIVKFMISPKHSIMFVRYFMSLAMMVEYIVVSIRFPIFLVFSRLQFFSAHLSKPTGPNVIIKLAEIAPKVIHSYCGSFHYQSSNPIDLKFLGLQPSSIVDIFPFLSFSSPFLGLC